MPDRPLHRRILAHLRSQAVAYVAVFLALSGGYALAANTKPKTITACADKKTGILHLHKRGRCQRGQTRVTWAARGPQGAKGATGATGLPGAAAISAWAVVGSAGNVLPGGHGLTISHTGSGTYTVTVTQPGCTGTFNAPTVTPSNGNPPSGQIAGAFPVAWIEDTGLNTTFTVITGDVVNGAFTAADNAFNVQDACS